MAKKIAPMDLAWLAEELEAIYDALCSDIDEYAAELQHLAERTYYVLDVRKRSLENTVNFVKRLASDEDSGDNDDDEEGF